MALDFVAGCLGGCAGIMVGYPLDTIKVHMQTQDYRNPKYKGTWHCFRSILAKESVIGFYRGMSSPMAGVAAVNAIVFGVYGQTQRHLPDPDHLSSYFLAGMFAGIAQTPVCSPIELAKTRLQLQSPSGSAFSGPIECLRHIYKQEGSRGVFKGLGITFLREAPSYGIYFLSYEAMTRSSSNEPVSTAKMLWAGGLAGTFSWVLTYPVDVVKSRIQADNGNRYSGILDCFKKSVKVEGYSCLYRGLNSTILRAFPTNAATFAVVTWTFRIFGEQTLDQNRTIENAASTTHKAPIEQKVGCIDKWHRLLENVSRKVQTDNFFSRSYYSMMCMSSVNVPIFNYHTSSIVNNFDKDDQNCAMVQGVASHKQEVIKCVNDNFENKSVDWFDVEDAIVECRCNLHRVMRTTELTDT